MARKKIFVSSSIGGQVLLLFNLIYSLASVPLALHYLNTEQFGLWALVLQLSNFFFLLDTGLSTAAGRLLIDVKDHRPSLAYGRMVVSTFAMLAVSGLGVFLAGWLFTDPLISWMRIPSGYEETAKALLLWQLAITAISLPVRIFGSLLVSHARLDWLNMAFAASLIAGLATMGVALYLGAGEFSLIWSGAAGVVAMLAIALWASLRYGLLPQRSEWSVPSLQVMKEVFLFGQNIFLTHVGGMVLNFSQTALLTRFAGLDLAAAWSVGSKLYQLMLQATSKFTQSSGPIFSEMFVRGEFDRLSHRLRQLKVLSWVMAVLGGLAIYSINSPFIQIWTHGKIVWPQSCNILLAVLLVLRVDNQVCGVHIGVSKIFGFYRFTNMVEAGLFVTLSVWLIPPYGMAGMLIASIVAALIAQTAYLHWREHLRSPGRISISERNSLLKLGLALGFCWALVAFIDFIFRNQSPIVTFGTGGLTLALGSLPAIYYLAHYLGAWPAMDRALAKFKRTKL